MTEHDPDAPDSHASNADAAADIDGDIDRMTDDPARRMREEVNAYASAILMKLLAIVDDIPATEGDGLDRLDLEIRQMLAFIDPARAAWLQEQPRPAPRPPASPPLVHSGALNGAALLDLREPLERIERLTADTDAALRAALDRLHADLQRTQAATDALGAGLRAELAASEETLRDVVARLDALDAAVSALAARRERAIDLSGVAEERVRLSAWRVALVAGLTAGSFVALVVALVALAW